ncbi:MAG: hypothetical protein AABX93_03225 [Nanoarchaeota archaeon]
MDSVKEAFQKVKQDMDFLNLNIQEINREILSLHEEIREINKNFEKIVNNSTPSYPTDNHFYPTNQQINLTNPTQIQHINEPFNQFKAEKEVFSTGNGGVPTDKQTNQQTDQHTQKSPFLEGNKGNSIENALQILNSLDSLKKEIRLKFKQLTEQELIVFTTMYELDEQIGFSDYKSISSKLNLTESSIRDYVGRLIKKGIPVEKKKINNKNIQLNISQNLKNLASLQTILSLRDI